MDNAAIGFDTYAKRKMDIAVVVYEGDLLMLELQARSINLFFRHNDINRIFIIANELNPAGLYAALTTHVLPEYGPLLSKVEIIPATHLMRPHVNASGWRTQQTLKLLISRYVSTEAYLLLDAKNHFVRPVDHGTFVDPKTGKMRTFRARSAGSLEKYLQVALAYYGLGEQSETLPSTTPFVMQTDYVRSMIAEIEAREGMLFDDFLHDPTRRTTEFFLYFAYLKSNADLLERSYRFGPRQSVGIFTKYPNTDAQMRALLDRLSDERNVCFALHRRRIAHLDDETTGEIVRLWHERGLFPTREESEAFLSRAKSVAEARTASVL